MISFSSRVPQLYRAFPHQETPPFSPPMGKDKFKEQKGSGGSRSGGDLGNFFTRSSATAQRRPESSNGAGASVLSPPRYSPGHAGDTHPGAVSGARHSSPEGPDHSRSHSHASLGSGDGWDTESQIKSLHSYLRSLLTS